MEFRIKLYQYYKDGYKPVPNSIRLVGFMPDVLNGDSITIDSKGPGTRSIFYNNIIFESELELDNHTFLYNKFKCMCGGRKNHIKYKIQFTRING